MLERRGGGWCLAAAALVVLAGCAQPAAAERAHAQAEPGAIAPRCWLKIVHPGNLTQVLLEDSLLVR
jgi:hypothetical protein